MTTPSDRTSSTSKRVRRRRLSDQVADDLKNRLVADGLKQGDRFPTEADLAEEYGVSRTVVREAGRILVERGLVDIRPGRGMVVADLGGEMLSRQLQLMLEVGQGSFDHLMEVRSALEVSISHWAAVRRTEEDIRRIQKTLAAFTDPPADSALGLEADLDFHTALTIASHNPFFEQLAPPIIECLRTAYELGPGYEAARGQTVREHEAIAVAVFAGDPDEAALATAEHLTRIRNTSQELISEQHRREV